MLRKSCINRPKLSKLTKSVKTQISSKTYVRFEPSHQKLICLIFSVLITGGAGDGDTTKTEVVDLEGQRLCTSKYGAFPQKNERGMSEYFARFPIVCGGGVPVNQITNQCWKFSNNKWVEFLKLEEDKWEAGSVISNGRLLITNGYGSNDFSKISQAIDRSLVQVENGPFIDEPMAGHCIVKTMTGPSKILVIHRDGFNEIRDESFNRLKDGPSPKYSRRSSGCGSFFSSKHDSREVIVVFGGEMDGEGDTKHKTVEVWDFTKEGSTWELLNENLPVPMAGRPEVIRSLDSKSVWIIFEKNIYKFHIEDDQYKFTKSSVELNVSRQFFSAIPIPIYSVIKC